MNKVSQAAQKHFFRDVALMVVGARALRSLGIRPGSFYGGGILGFCGGNMAGVYGFDARNFLSGVEQVMNGGTSGNGNWSFSYSKKSTTGTSSDSSKSDE